MSNEAITLKLDEAVAQGSNLTRTLKASFSGAIAVARVAAQIRAALTTEMVQEIMQIKETDFGWRTDGKNYTLEQIRDAWVDAALKGAVPVNNEVNIISGRAYLCKNYFSRMIREFPGLTDFVAIPGKVVMLQTGALVEYTATWKLNGKSMTLARTKDSAIPVRLNAGMGADGALGKAERKLKAGVFSILTGSAFEDEDVEFDEIKPSTVVTERKEPAMPQNVLPEPTAAKAGTTQTKATTEKIKKAVAEKKPEPTPEPVVQQDHQDQQDERPAGDDGGAAPWETGGEEPAQAEPPVETQQAVAESAAQPAAEEKVVGYVRSGPNEEFKQVKKKIQPAATAFSPTQQSPAAGSGVVETDHPGKITSVRGVGPTHQPPYRVTGENATVYRTDQKALAEKASALKKGNAPVEIDYAVDGKGEYQIIDIRPDGSGEQTATEMQ